MYHKDRICLPGLWNTIHTLLSAFLLQRLAISEFENMSYKHHKYGIHPPALVCLN